MSDRSLWVDYSKAIGIVLVVYGHVARGVYNASIPVNVGVYTLVDSLVYTFHMPLFFFLSGLFFMNSLGRRGRLKLISSKIDTIVYPYLLWSLIQGGVIVVLSSFTNNKVEASTLLTILWQPQWQFWFLYALFMIFVFSSILFNSSENRLILLAFAVSILLYIFQKQLPSAYNLGFITNNLVFFIAGILYDRYKKLFPGSGDLNFTLFAFIIFAVSQYIFHLQLDMNYEDKGVLSLLLAMISIVFIVLLSQSLVRKPIHWFLIVGSASMSIYLLHILAGSGVRIILVNLFYIYDPAIHLVIGTLAGVIFPVVVFYFAKHYVWVNYLFSAPLSRLIKK
ncbi:acyltransferase family protein [Endozoicomonas acroporae]|uniref:acyltransferase family protein n=1 Tax=Endozoicomonas acroporae TaxID=1701104 RepID=UPI003D7BA6FC